MSSNDPLFRYHSVQGTYVGRDEVVISRKRLAELEKIERAHAAYLEATQRMRVMQATLESRDPEKHTGWHLGWISCLRAFSEAVIDAARRQEAA